MNNENKTLWKLLWDYDPNGLIVMNLDWQVTLANPSFCRMFAGSTSEIIGSNAIDILGDISDFQTVWETDKVIRNKEVQYPNHKLWVKQVIFPIKNESIVAGIMVDITHEILQKRGMLKLKQETLGKVRRVVDNQMHVAQQIAGLLGETTAETKVSLLNLIQMLDQETD